MTNNNNFYGSASSTAFENWIEERIKTKNDKLKILIDQLNERLNNQEKIINEIKLLFLPDPTNILFYEKIYASTINPYDIDVDVDKPSSNADAADATDS
jgi:hypothetical protein